MFVYYVHYMLYCKYSTVLTVLYRAALHCAVPYTTVLYSTKGRPPPFPPYNVAPPRGKLFFAAKVQILSPLCSPWAGLGWVGPVGPCVPYTLYVQTGARTNPRKPRHFLGVKVGWGGGSD